MSYRACLCDCHQDRRADVLEAATGSAFGVRELPDIEPRPIFGDKGSIEAVIACNGCVKNHVDILKNRAIWSNRTPPDPLAWLAIQPLNKY